MIGRKSLAWWVITTHGRRRRETEDRLADPAYADLRVLRFRSSKAADAWAGAQPDRMQRLERVERGPDRRERRPRRRTRRRAAWRSIAHSSARRQPDPADGPLVLVGQREVGDGRVVGRERDRDAEPVEAGERVGRDRRRRCRPASSRSGRGRASRRGRSAPGRASGSSIAPGPWAIRSGSTASARRTCARAAPLAGVERDRAGRPRARPRTRAAWVSGSGNASSGPARSNPIEPVAAEPRGGLGERRRCRPGRASGARWRSAGPRSRAGPRPRASRGPRPRSRRRGRGRARRGAAAPTGSRRSGRCRPPSSRPARTRSARAPRRPASARSAGRTRASSSAWSRQGIRRDERVEHPVPRRAARRRRVTAPARARSSTRSEPSRWRWSSALGIASMRRRVAGGSGGERRRFGHDPMLRCRADEAGTAGHVRPAPSRALAIVAVLALGCRRHRRRRWPTSPAPPARAELTYAGDAAGRAGLASAAAELDDALRTGRPAQRPRPDRARRPRRRGDIDDARRDRRPRARRSRRRSSSTRPRSASSSRRCPGWVPTEELTLLARRPPPPASSSLQALDATNGLERGVVAARGVVGGGEPDHDAADRPRHDRPADAAAAGRQEKYADALAKLDESARLHGPVAGVQGHAREHGRRLDADPLDRRNATYDAALRDLYQALDRLEGPGDERGPQPRSTPSGKARKQLPADSNTSGS